MTKRKSREPKHRQGDLLTPREQRVFSLMRDGLSDEQIAERLEINVATVEYEVWGVLSKLGFESRAQAAAWGPAPQVPLPEPPYQLPLLEPADHDSPKPVSGAVAASAPATPQPRINLSVAAQAFGIGLALFGLGLIAWGVVRLARDDRGEFIVAVPTPSPVETTTTPGPTNPPATITPFPTVIPEEPIGYGQFGFLRSLYSITPDGSEFYTVLPRPPRAYALSPDAAQLAYVQGYGDIDLKFISAGGEALRSVRLDGVFNVDGLVWPPDGSRLVLSVQVPATTDASGQPTLKNTIALLDSESGGLTIFDSPPLLPNGLITLPGEPPALVPHPNSGAALSPDGAYVAWPTGDGQIQIAPVSGDVPPAVVEGDLPAWSADGSRLAFQAGGEIHIVDRDGAGEEVLVPGSQPAWAPADSIAFIRDGELYVIDPDTGEETQLTGIDLPFASSPRWSPDGARVLFTYAPLSPEIFTVGPNGEDRILLVPGIHPQWSPDGASIAFASNGTSTGGTIYVMTADAGAITPLPASILLSSTSPPDAGCHAHPFQWSPLGDRIAFCNASSGTIEIVGLSGESTIVVASGTSFSWAPDGNRIAFTGAEGEGAEARPVVYLADLAQPDAPPERLAEGTTPDWSPDGAKIAYVAGDGLHIADLATGDNTLIASGDIVRSHVSWAPDSSRLAYVSAGRIFVADLASIETPIAIAEGRSPQWSPDGTQLAYYTRDAAGNEDLWAVPADASAPPRHLGKGRFPAWSPDSARLAYDRFVP